MLISSIKNRYDYENKSRMFESINDLDFLDEFVIEDIDDIAKNFTEGKSVQIKFDGEKINVYAYKFADNKSCRNFAEEISGNEKEIYVLDRFGICYKLGKDSKTETRYKEKIVRIITYFVFSIESILILATSSKFIHLPQLSHILSGF